MAQYWLLDWLDTEGVESIDSARRLLQGSTGVQRLQERAAMAATEAVAERLTHRPQIVAGMGMDLSGHFECSAVKCMKLQVDTLLKQAWHYFDTIIVNGLDPNDGKVRNYHHDTSADFVEMQIELALYIRSIGAEECLVFTRKPAYCDKHLSTHAIEAGLRPLDELTSKLADQLSIGYKFRQLSVEEGKWHYAFAHPALDIVQTGKVDALPNEDEADFARRIALRTARRYSGHLIRDVALARSAHAPLGQATSALASEVYPRPQATTADVALNLRLPFVEGISAKELIEIRQEQADSFEIFRSALKESIEKRVAVMADSAAEEIADSVRSDVLDPAIAELNRKLNRSVSAMSKRALGGSAIGMALTTVGLISMAPLVVPGIVLAAGGVLAAGAEYVKDKKEVELSDLYFLWRLSERSSLHR